MEENEIPQNWKNIKLKDVSIVIMGQSPDSKYYNIKGNGEYLIQGNNDISDRRSLPKIHTSQITKRCKVNDILLSVRAPVGDTAISVHNACIGRGICAIRATNADQNFLFQKLLYIEKKWKKYEQGSTFTAINSKDIKNLKIIIPEEIIEQKKIAEVLSIWDLAIEKTEALIKEKENLKKGLMQKLLTGKVRFKEFIEKEGFKDTEIGKVPEDWWIKLVSDVSNISTGNRDTQDKVDSGLYPFFVRSNNIERINTYSFEGEAILTAGDGVGTGKVFHYINGRFDFHQRVYKISDFQNVHPKYLYYYFKNNFLRQVKKYTAKTSVDSVRMEMITKMKFPFPTIKEQEKIASMFTSLELQIEQKNELLTSLKEQKKGLMQQLLTGKTRVKVDDT